MISMSMEVHGAKEAAASLKSIEAALARRIPIIHDQFRSFILGRARAAVPVGKTGKLRGSIYGNLGVHHAFSGMMAVLRFGSKSPYAAAQEFGVKTPQLVEYGEARSVVTFRFSGNRYGSYIKARKAMRRKAFIRHQNIPAHPFILPAFYGNQGVLSRIIDMHLQAAIKESKLDG